MIEQYQKTIEDRFKVVEMRFSELNAKSDTHRSKDGENNWNAVTDSIHTAKIIGVKKQTDGT
jgi:hypothetical protein